RDHQEIPTERSRPTRPGRDRKDRRCRQGPASSTRRRRPRGRGPWVPTGGEGRPREHPPPVPPIRRSVRLLQVARGTRRASRILGLRSLIGLRLALRVASDRSESRTILTALPARIPGSLETLAFGIRLLAVRSRDRGQEQTESRSPVDGEAPEVLEHCAHPRLDRLLLDPSMPLEDVRDPSMSPTERDRGLSLSRELEISAFQSEGRVRTRPAPDDGALDDGRGQRDRVSRILDLDG